MIRTFSAYIRNYIRVILVN